MPTAAQNRLTHLMAEGLTVYPANMRGLAAKMMPSPDLTPARLYIPPPRKPLNMIAGSRFLEWVKGEHPSLYAAAQRRVSVGTPPKRGTFAGLGADAKADSKAGDAMATAGPLERFVNTVTALAPQYLQYRAQQELLDVQLDRARQGLPPLRPTDYAPAVQLSVDPSMYSPQLEALKPWLLYGGIAVAGLFLFKMLGGKRR